ncbi:hypothetical protein CSC70_04865 [Pseudoxanthomonas kalamensis DSM 18571]|uniref:hypothetical protein n=1 Tax=Pseudoxanthomonas kalamensis TaxID=289483 RepID=UPI001391C53D|nr:hypothetical protein [Pseudoxanthomonas kalamensis]KAF1711250.1 hypothetical protein CSC70_04865 [Pseudoxanthomonas kalamensis DSM 18571]
MRCHARIAITLLPLALAAVPASAIAQQLPQKTLTPQATRAIQSSQISSTQVELPASHSGVRVPAPPKTLALPKPPPPSATQRRKLLALRDWGLNVGASALKPSYLLTPQQPYLANGAVMSVVSDRGTTIDYASKEGLPYGSIKLLAVDSMVIFKDIPATPRDWLLVECYEAGDGYHYPDGFDLTASVTHPNSPTPAYMQGRSWHGSAYDDNQIRGYTRHVPPGGGIVGFVLVPSTQSKRTITLKRRPVSTFGGCEVTPVNP